MNQALNFRKEWIFMKCDTNKKIRICPQCGCEITDPKAIRCPRCNKIILKKCSECDGCTIKLK